MSQRDWKIKMPYFERKRYGLPAALLLCVCLLTFVTEVICF